MKTNTPRRHGARAPIPGERESVLDMLARANARGAVAPPVGSKPYAPACRACANSPAPKVGVMRQATPCSHCGGVRG